MQKERNDEQPYFDRTEKEIAQRIQRRRMELGYSYQTLASLTGMSKSSLQRYETGDIKNIPLSRLEILSNALDVSPDWLLGWSTDYKTEESQFKDLLSKVKATETIEDPVIQIIVDELTKTDTIWELLSGYAVLDDYDREHLMETLNLLLIRSALDLSPEQDSIQLTLGKRDLQVPKKTSSKDN